MQIRIAAPSGSLVGQQSTHQDRVVRDPDLAAFESQRQGVNRFSFPGVNGSERLHADPIPFQLLDHRLSDAVERVPARYRGRDWEKPVADSRRELTILKSA
jgi:hypothetical protein